MSGFYLANPRDQVRTDWLMRFAAPYWRVNFPRPMMAAATVETPGTLRIDLNFLKKDDLAGVIWESADSVDHPLLRYETKRDYRGMELRFRWRAEGAVRALDAVDGAVLTIEGRDESGTARSWYVRLWNYASGTPWDAEIVLRFDELDGGFLLPQEADPVWAGDVDRMFVSLVPEGHHGSDAPLASREDATVWLEDIRADGTDAAIRIGDAWLPPHGFRAATGYDDQCDLTPTWVLRNLRALGYREWLTFYVGMSHFMALESDRAGAFRVNADAADPLVPPARRWFEDLAAICKEAGITPIWSLSYELLDQHCPEGWKQRAADGAPALTGWEPPSSLLSPANAEAMGWLQKVARALMEIAAGSGAEPWFQVGEPWWWVGPDGRPCFYDAAALAAYGADPGATMTGLIEKPDAAQTLYIGWLGETLATSVLALRDAAKDAAPDAKTALLFYAPQVLGDAPDWLRDVNMPAGFGAPAFDVLQLEDYDFVTEGNAGASRRAAEAVEARLGYPAAEQHYFSGFVLSAEDAQQWWRIAAAADEARRRGVAKVFLWALPQVMRDGFTIFESDGEESVQAFHDVVFPLAIGAGASGGPEFLTTVTETVSGHEARASLWATGRLQYDAGPGLRSEEDVKSVIRFFRARKGRAHAFRFRDPVDCTSGAGETPGPFDEVLGAADGERSDFPLIKRYGEDDDAELRRITHPEAGSVVVAVDGVPVTDGWVLEAGGLVRFSSAPASGLVTAGFRFDVPVRFAEDRLEASVGAWRAGDLVSVPLVEVRDA